MYTAFCSSLKSTRDDDTSSKHGVQPSDSYCAFKAGLVFAFSMEATSRVSFRSDESHVANNDNRYVRGILCRRLLEFSVLQSLAFLFFFFFFLFFFVINTKLSERK